MLRPQTGHAVLVRVIRWELRPTETSTITERYTLIEVLKTWTEAQQYCREHHTDLVSIKNASENEDLVKKAQGKTFWIGLFNEPWKWSHQGDSYTFHYWKTGDPDNAGGNQKCVKMLKSGEWNDYSCNTLLPFFCYDGTPVPEDLHLISDSMVWPEAWQYCRDHYTDLVSLTSLAAQNRVSELVRNSTASRFWIGLHRTVVYDNWYWVAVMHFPQDGRLPVFIHHRVDPSMVKSTTNLTQNPFRSGRRFTASLFITLLHRWPEGMGRGDRRV
ncbi:UNVERIFIED_CONTAM: hypothetical protein FKN15_008120 [Acipenser sinensis]